MAEEFPAAEGSLPARDGRLLAWYADLAYGTGELRAAIASAGHRAR